jgi:hypothetical protein
MIKTLRITSYFVAVLAVVAFALPAVFGFRSDEQIEQFLSSAGVVEEFREAKGEKGRGDKRETSPLVKQAEAFALYLNPPPKPTQAPSAPVARGEPRPMGSVAAKFKLIGTSRHTLQPELSLALIDEPGKGMYWVRQSSKVGHLIIEQVRDGVVVIRDGQNTYELVAERPEKTSLLKANTSPSGRITDVKPTILNAEVSASKNVRGKRMSVEETEAIMKKVLDELGAMRAGAEAAQQADVGVSGTDSNSMAEKIAAAKKRLENMRISTKEARGLGRLGRRLRNVQQQQDRAGDNRTENDTSGVSHPQAGLVEPNLNRPDLDKAILNEANIPR